MLNVARNEKPHAGNRRTRSEEGDVASAKPGRRSQFCTKIAVGAIALTMAMCGFAIVGPADYVQDGLVALYDGVYNAVDAHGEPVHDANALAWRNLARGAGDIVLPEMTKIADDSVTLPVVATASDCSCARLSPITLETCVMSTTAATGNDKAFVTIPGRVLVGYDGRNYGITVATSDGSNWGNSKMRYYRSGTWEFQPYASSVHVISYASTINAAGTLYADGEQQTTPSYFWTSDVVAAPTGELKIGNSTVSYTYNCVRVYSRALTADEAKLNAAIDAVRYKNVDPATVPLPEGWSFDAATNLVSTAWASQHRITTPGTVTFEAPYAEAKQLVNATAFGRPVIFDESTQPKNADHAISFSGFDAIAYGQTVFKGGWWDFGEGAFLPMDKSWRTVTIQGGAVVTNVGAVTLAGATGTYNRMRITEESAMSAASVTLGTKDGEQHNDLEIMGGASLTLGDNLKMSAYPDKIGNDGNNRTRNVVTVAGEGTTLNVAHATYLSWVSSGYNASTGGNSLYVTNGATASLGHLRLTQGLYYGGDDIAYFADGAHIATTSIRIADSWSSANGRKGTTRLVVASGSTVTNTGDFAIGSDPGYDRTSLDTLELVVSNGTFHTDQLRSAANVSTLLAGPRATIRLSGPEAKATFNYTTTNFALFGNPDNTFIIENQAMFHWPWFSFSYTANNTTRETVIVRGVGTKMTFDTIWNFGTASSSSSITAYTNRFVFADGAVVEGNSIRVGGQSGELSVSNATLFVSDNRYARISAEPVSSDGIPALVVGAHFQRGGIGTNCVVAISGTCPHIVCTNGSSAEFRRATQLVFNLPAAGYEEGVVPFEIGNLLTMSANCAIMLNGAQDMLAKHNAFGRVGAKYVLVKAKALSIPESILETARANLPADMKLTVRKGKSGDEELVLQVGKCGLMMIVR